MQYPGQYPISGPPISPYGHPYPMPQHQQVVVNVVAHQAPTSGYAVTSLVLSIIGLVTGCCSFGIPSIIAVLCGHLGLSDTKNGQRSGRGMAVAGLVMGYLVAAPAAVISIWFVFAGGMAAISGDPNPTSSP